VLQNNKINGRYLLRQEENSDDPADGVFRLWQDNFDFLYLEISNEIQGCRHLK